MAGVVQAAAMFGGGVACHQAIARAAAQLPEIRAAEGNELTVKVSLRVLAASIPGLDAPGMLSHQRPYLEASLGSSKKVTEFADFAGDKQECPWRFSDTLTFRARPEDIAGPGIRLNLKARKDVILGPLQLEMQSSDIGEGVVDLPGRVLPACGWAESSCSSEWATPTLLVPLVHVRGGLCGGEVGLGEKVAHLAIVVSVDADPEEVLALAARMAPGRASLAKGTLGRGIGAAAAKLEAGLGNAIQWLDKPVDVSNLVAPVDAAAARRMSRSGALRHERSTSQEEAGTGLLGPDAAPEDWVCRRGPGGRTHWHHRALGPAPWELEGFSPSEPSSPAATAEPAADSPSRRSAQPQAPERAAACTSDSSSSSHRIEDAGAIERHGAPARSAPCHPTSSPQPRRRADACGGRPCESSCVEKRRSRRTHSESSKVQRADADQPQAASASSQPPQQAPAVSATPPPAARSADALQHARPGRHVWTTSPVDRPQTSTRPSGARPAAPGGERLLAASAVYHGAASPAARAVYPVGARAAPVPVTYVSVSPQQAYVRAGVISCR